MTSNPQPTRIEIEDPIVEAFPIMSEAARLHCRPDGDVGNGCFTYHRLWPYRRRLGLNPAALARADYFVTWYRRMARSDAPRRVMVSGSADYGLLAQVLHAYRTEQIEPEVTVLDICEAPLVVNRWYAEREQAEINTVCSDILRFTSDTGFGVITTDNFLSRIDPTQRPPLISKWRDLLCKGGRVITTEVVAVDESVLDPEAEKNRIEDKIAWLVERTEGEDLNALGITREKLIAYAREHYAARIYSPISSSVQLRQLFEANGFKIDEFSPAVSHRNRRRPNPLHHRRFNVVATRTT